MGGSCKSGQGVVLWRVARHYGTMQQRPKSNDFHFIIDESEFSCAWCECMSRSKALACSLCPPPPRSSRSLPDVRLRKKVS